MADRNRTFRIGQHFRRRAEAGEARHSVSGGFGPFRQRHSRSLTLEEAAQRVTENVAEDNPFFQGFFAAGAVGEQRIGETREARQKREAEHEATQTRRRERRQRRPLGSTIATGPLGVRGEARVNRPTLLGQ